MGCCAAYVANMLWRFHDRILRQQGFLHLIESIANHVAKGVLNVVAQTRGIEAKAPLLQRQLLAVDGALRHRRAVRAHAGRRAGSAVPVTLGRPFLCVFNSEA